MKFACQTPQQLLHGTLLAEPREGVSLRPMFCIHCGSRHRVAVRYWSCRRFAPQPPAKLEVMLRPLGWRLAGLMAFLHACYPTHLFVGLHPYVRANQHLEGENGEQSRQ